MSDAAKILSQGIEEPWERTEARLPLRTEKARFAILGGHCACDAHGAPPCDRCREHALKLRSLHVCRCGRLLMRAGDPVCPACDPSVRRPGRNL